MDRYNQREFLISRAKSVLLIIDMQDKFKPVIPNFDTIVYNILKLVLGFQLYRMPIIVTEQYPKGLGHTDIRIGKQFSNLKAVEKIELSCTECQGFWEQVKPLAPRSFVLCGIETHVCVCQTALGLIEQGYSVHIVVDATSTRNSLDYETGLRKMEIAGAIPCTTEMVLFELAEKAGTNEFKYIQKMVKSSKGKDNFLQQAQQFSAEAQS